MFRGRRLHAARAERHASTEWESSWPAALDPLQPTLERMLRDLGCRHARAVVLADTPTALCATHSLPLAAGRRAARDAAMLALNNVRPGGAPTDDPADSVILAADSRASLRGGSNPDTTPPMRHVLAFSERDSTADAIGRWVEASGCRFEGLIPLEAVETITAVEQLTANAGPPETEALLAVLWVGEHRSVLAVGTPDRTRIIRSMSLGVESIAEALTRPIISRRESNTTITLTRERARDILASVGIPARDQVVDPEAGLAGNNLLPLIQPVLQRLALEVKQSLRFGLTEPERARVNLRLAGPGAGVRNLRSALAVGMGLEDSNSPLPTSAAEPHESARADAPIAVDSLLLAVRTNFPRLPRLLPAAHRHARELARARAALRVGVAAALALVGGDAVVSWFESATLRAAADVATTRSLDPSILEQLTSARRAADQLDRHVAARLGAEPRWAPFLAAVSDAAEGRVALTEITLDFKEGLASARLTGAALMANGDAPDSTPEEAAQRLRAFIDNLSDCPIVDKATLRHASRAVRADRPVQTFDLDVSFVPVPAWPRRITTGGEQP